MPIRIPTDKRLQAKRIANDIKVLRYLITNVKSLAKGRKESPEKLVIFYAGYSAMRSLWEVKTNKGTISTGDAALDVELSREPGRFIFRVDVEVSHSIGNHTKTLLRVATFRYWGNKILALWAK